MAITLRLALGFWSFFSASFFPASFLAASAGSASAGAGPVIRAARV